MKLEHVAIDVPDPEAFIGWWCENLGFRRSAPGSAFIMDDSGTAGLEVYRTDRTAAAPDYRAMDPMTLHVAFVSADVEADAKRLVAAGATLVELKTGDDSFHMAMLRDPWGVPVQLCRRAKTVFVG
jgi:catechol 2,3-dioxygenase-like lactoylglutathione lyase family enzyme